MPLSAAAEVDGAVRAGAQAFPSRSGKPIKERSQNAYRFRELPVSHIDEPSELIRIDPFFKVC